MTEQNSGTNGNGRGHRAAHDRLATGSLANWARASATHPWRVVVAWIGIIAALIALVATVGGAFATSSRFPDRTRRRRPT